MNSLLNQSLPVVPGSVTPTPATGLAGVLGINLQVIDSEGVSLPPQAFAQVLGGRMDALAGQTDPMPAEGAEPLPGLPAMLQTPAMPEALDGNPLPLPMRIGVVMAEAGVPAAEAAESLDADSTEGLVSVLVPPSAEADAAPLPPLIPVDPANVPATATPAATANGQTVAAAPAALLSDAVRGLMRPANAAGESPVVNGPLPAAVSAEGEPDAGIDAEPMQQWLGREPLAPGRELPPLAETRPRGATELLPRETFSAALAQSSVSQSSTSTPLGMTAGDLALSAARGMDVQRPVPQAQAQPAPPPMPPGFSTSLGSSGWDGELGDRVRYMVGNKLNRAEINIRPAHLGPVEVRIAMQGEQQAQVTLVSTHAPVREAMEAALPRLREMLGDQGINQLEVNVSSQSGGHDGQGQRAFAGLGEGAEDQPGGSGLEPEDIADGLDEELTEVSLARQGDGLLNTYA